ncbi:TPA: DUF2850 domain-containing protein [Vibrio harveyi]|uniref:DUF2850 domain-containing protein n=1 Tax=Vibrio harveyi TaxID=669 RepID=UPI0005395E5D|nr:DUF2850 domain-containing protein [Vibrio harveyi]AIV07900.1 hypothetical protein LA59_20930 [Vibrio harveyi]HDM8168978.1 DUF2850 domain-containing protein [Vibrio harveyi]
MTTTARRKRKQKPEPQPSFWARHQFKIIKGGFAVFGCSLISVLGYQLYASYLDYIDPNKIYGEWIEIGAPPYQTEQLSFTPEGVFRNHRLITTQFEFDGKVITLNTGLGKTEYQISGSHLSPQIRRIEPRLPDQRFILKGFEHTVQGSETGAASKRRAALSEHFSRK